MTDYRTATSIGERIQAARKDRGMRTAADLAAAIPDGVVKESTIQNVEAGRKAELTVSQLLNLALALRVPPIYLLAPVGTPDATLDLANLSSDFKSMTVVEFDAWLSGTTSGAYRATSTDEHQDRNHLQAIRELNAAVTERTRLERVRQLEREVASSANSKNADDSPSLQDAQLTETNRRINDLRSYLKSAGLAVDEWIL